MMQGQGQSAHPRVADTDLHMLSDTAREGKTFFDSCEFG